MFKKLKEFDAKYSTVFFCISLLIIIVFLAYFSVSYRDKENSCVIPNDIVNNYTNYSYKITYSKDDNNLIFYVKRYDSKYLIELHIDEEIRTYYMYYTDIYEKASNGEYIRFRNDYIVEDFDNKLLFLDYINDISLKSNITTDDELTCYINRKSEISMCINLDDSITLKAKDYTLLYEIDGKGNVNEFNVNIN